jgi:hypothetical protein
MSEGLFGLAFIVAGILIAARWRPQFLRRLKGSVFDPVVATVVIMWAIGLGAILHGLVVL